MLFTVVMAFTGCMLLNTASDYDKNINFAKLKSFSYYDKGIEQLALNNLDKPRMLNAVETAMAKMGFNKTDQPDFLVNVAVLSNVKARADWGYSGGGYQWDATASAYQWKDSQFGPINTNKQYQDGTIIIDFLNPRTKAIIWHGLCSGFNFDDYDNRELRINSAVKQILMQYPPVY
jgi:hypothetical protein